jgi:membrane-bound ClpP family serine protease
MTALGLVLVLAGVAAVAFEAHRPTHGVLGTTGIAALAAGAALAVEGAGGGLAAVVAAAAVLGVAALIVVALSLTKAVAVRRRRIRSGREAMIGRCGVVNRWDERGGTVLVDGALWRARLEEGLDEAAAQLREGDEVIVEYVSGLTLIVRRAERWELAGW